MFFLVAGPDENPMPLIARNTLQAVIDYLHMPVFKFYPYENLRIFTSNDSTMSISFVDGKLFIQ